MTRVGWDLDGVAHMFRSNWWKFCVEHGYLPADSIPAHKIPGYGFYYAYGMDDATFVRICHEAADAGVLFHGPVIPGAVEGMRELHDHGIENHIVTDRSWGTDPSVSHIQTFDWLADNDFKYHSVTFSRDKTSVPTDWFIEDQVNNYDALDAAGVKVYLLNGPNNSDVTDDRRRVDTLGEFVGIVLSAEFAYV